MEEEQQRIKVSKRLSQFDFDKCLEGTFSADDGSSLEKRHKPHCPDGMEKFRNLSEQELEEAIRRMTANVNGGFCSKLPDKGAKYKANFRCYQEERHRRQFLTGASKCTRLDDTKRSKPMGVTAEAKKEAPSLSEFASKLSAKLEAGNASCTWEPNNEQVICDVFDKDLKTLDHGDRRKRKQQNKPFTHDEKQKIGRSIEGKDKTRLVSIKTLNEASERDLAEKSERHKQKDACQVLRSDTSNGKKTVVLLDEEEPDLEDTTPTVEVAERDTTVYYPSRDDHENVEIQFKDLNCLAPGEYLTSPIMNFYIRFLQGPSSAAKIASSDYLFFNTYFYKKLQEAMFRQRTNKESSFTKFRRWWRGVNIFQKAYMFLPIHEDLHWSLAIVCIPDKAVGSGPIILHLDSLGYHSSRAIFQNIRRFLREEWNIVKEEIDTPDDFMTSRIWKQLPRRVEERIVKVPQQNNDFDCGLFVLYFMERFIEDAPLRLRKQDLKLLEKRWFKPEEASNLRVKIKMKLKEQFQKLKSTFEPVN